MGKGVDKLIGLKFRRNKYGLSLWEDTIQSVDLNWYFTTGWTRPIVVVKGTLHSYDIDEIVVYTSQITIREVLGRLRRDGSNTKDTSTK